MLLRVGNLLGLYSYEWTTRSKTTLQWYHPTPKWVLEGVYNAVTARYRHKQMQVVHLYVIAIQMSANSLTRLVKSRQFFNSDTLFVTFAYPSVGGNTLLLWLINHITRKSQFVAVV